MSKKIIISKNEVEEYLKTRGYDIVQHHCQRQWTNKWIEKLTTGSTIFDASFESSLKNVFGIFDSVGTVK